MSLCYEYLFAGLADTGKISVPVQWPAAGCQTKVSNQLGLISA